MILVMGFDSEAILKAAQDELNAKLRDLARLEREIAGLRQVIDGIATIKKPLALGEAMGGHLNLRAAADYPDGLTDCIRAIFQGTQHALTPPQVKELLDLKEFNWSSFSNPLSAIHTVLKRLADKDEIAPTNIDGKTHYRGVGPAERKRRRRYYGEM